METRCIRRALPHGACDCRLHCSFPRSRPRCGGFAGSLCIAKHCAAMAAYASSGLAGALCAVWRSSLLSSVITTWLLYLEGAAEEYDQRIWTFLNTYCPKAGNLPTGVPKSGVIG